MFRLQSTRLSHLQTRARSILSRSASRQFACPASLSSPCFSPQHRLFSTDSPKPTPSAPSTTVIPTSTPTPLSPKKVSSATPAAATALAKSAVPSTTAAGIDHGRWLRSQKRAHEEAAEKLRLEQEAAQKASGSSSSGEKTSESPPSSSSSAAPSPFVTPLRRGGFNDWIVVAVIGANLWIYLIWSASPGKTWDEKEAKNSDTHQWIKKYFVLTPKNLSEQWSTALTHQFAQYEPQIMAINAIGLLLFSRGVIKAAGLKSYLPVYLISGAVGAGYCLVGQSQLKKYFPARSEKYDRACFGATNSVLGLATVWMLIFRKMRHTLPFRGGMKLPTGFLLGWLSTMFVGTEIYQTYADFKAGRPSAADRLGALGSIFAGVLFYFVRFRTPAARAAASRYAPFGTNTTTVAIRNPLYKPPTTTTTTAPAAATSATSKRAFSTWTASRGTMTQRPFQPLQPQQRF